MTIWFVSGSTSLRLQFPLVEENTISCRLIHTGRGKWQVVLQAGNSAFAVLYEPDITFVHVGGDFCSILKGNPDPIITSLGSIYNAQINQKQNEIRHK